MFKHEKPATIVKQSNEVAPLEFAKAHNGKLTMKYIQGIWKVAFISERISTHAYGSTLENAYRNMLKAYEEKDEYIIRKRLMETIFRKPAYNPQSLTSKTVA